MPDASMQRQPKSPNQHRLHSKLKKVVLIASGPSLAPADVNLARNKALVAVVNVNHELAPWADLLYACDGKWWDCHRPAFVGEKWTQCIKSAETYGLNFIPGIHAPGLSFEAGLIHFGAISGGGNSGFQLLNLVIQLGAREIGLLGYDMQPTGGKNHWFGNHPAGFQEPKQFGQWIASFEIAAKQLAWSGIRIINCSRESALTCFERLSIDQFLMR